MRRLRGLTPADLLIGIAVGALILAFLYPTLRAWSLRGLVEDVIAEVETLRSGATAVFAQTGAWPTAGAPGRIPTEVSIHFAADSSLARSDYTLQWTIWEVVEQVMAPASVAPVPFDADAVPDSVEPAVMPVVRHVGGIVVYASDDALLAELLARYGPDASFVRDTAWTLVVERSGGGP
jgi:hypothetical protein